MGAGARATHPPDRRTWPRSTQRTIEGNVVRGWGWEERRLVCVSVPESRARFWKDQGRKCSGRDQERNVFAF